MKVKRISLKFQVYVLIKVHFEKRSGFAVEAAEYVAEDTLPIRL